MKFEIVTLWLDTVMEPTAAATSVIDLSMRFDMFDKC